MKSQPDFVLSVEELALAASLVGHPEDAAVILRASLGEISQDEARARLDAAGHSLMARGWIVAGSSDSASPQLRADLKSVLEGVAGTQFTLQYEKRTLPLPAQAVSFHFGLNRRVLSHVITHGSVHNLGWVTTQDVLITGMAFFDVPKEEWSVEMSPITIPSEPFGDVYKAETPQERQQAMAVLGLPDDLRKMLEEDFSQASYRGAIVLLQYDEQRRPFSRSGAFVLKGSRRVWLFAAPEPDAEVLRIEPFTPETFRSLVQRLLILGEGRA